MKRFALLIYEDDADWIEGFAFNIKPRLAEQGIECMILHKVDSSTLMADIEFVPNLIMVDHDLGLEVGADIVEQIADDPQCSSTSIFYYSGGESVETLRELVKQIKGAINCYTKEGDDLMNAVIAKALK